MEVEARRGILAMDKTGKPGLPVAAALGNMCSCAILQLSEGTVFSCSLIRYEPPGRAV